MTNKIMSWEDVLEELESWGSIYNNCLDYCEGEFNFHSLWNYNCEPLVQACDIITLIEKCLEQAPVSNRERRKIKAEDVIHYQSSVEINGLKRIYDLVASGEWEDDYEQVPLVILIPEIEKYLVFNGNHRTTVLAILQMEITCEIVDSPFLSDILGLLVKDYWGVKY